MLEPPQEEEEEPEEQCKYLYQNAENVMSKSNIF
jgi:hypothetical protein